MQNRVGCKGDGSHISISYGNFDLEPCSRVDPAHMHPRFEKALRVNKLIHTPAKFTCLMALII